MSQVYLRPFICGLNLKLVKRKKAQLKNCQMKYKIKNMVCSRCVRLLSQELSKSSIALSRIDLGEIETDIALSDANLKQVDTILLDLGFERITSKNASIIEKIKSELIQFIQNSNDWDDFKLSDFLEKKIGIEYKKLSSLFSSVESLTIEKYFILQKIEKAKELIIYDELSLSEIAYELAYSSGQHFSNQFKSIIGLTPSQFKKSTMNSRKSLDSI